MVAIPLLSHSLLNVGGESITVSAGESRNLSLESNLDDGGDRIMDIDEDNNPINESDDGDTDGDNDQILDMDLILGENDILKLEVQKPSSSSALALSPVKKVSVAGSVSSSPLAVAVASSSNPNSTCNRCGQQQQRQLMPSVYKDVVVIGNGPSGIALSYFLAGNWPYYNGCGENVNEMLHYRLMAASSKKAAMKEDENKNRANMSDTDGSSIVQQDLHFLSQGLEGRSSNPVALLFDTLNHPDADLGLELPSLLNWKKRPSKAIDHVVLGKGPPGGAWQMMDGNVLTISLGCWMELPQLNFREWEAAQEARCSRGESRASVASVAQYYCDYVSSHELGQYFVSHSEITEVTRIPCSPAAAGLPLLCDNLPGDVLEAINGVGGEVDENPHRLKARRHTISEIPVNCQNEIALMNRNSRTLWQVHGFTRDPSDGGRRNDFCYLTSNLVLATGSSDSPNILNVPGENLDFVIHSLKNLEELIMSGQLNQHSDPILVVGAGLSAADAIIAARFHSIPVIHVFRRSVEDKSLIFKQLPENMYPEYHKVYQMMQDPKAYDGYKAYEQYVVAEIGHNRRIKLMGPLSSGVVKVSNIVICIGSHPDLSFLCGLEHNIGVHPGRPIDCKRNPIAIDFSTHQSVREPGLFALGPLVGENFVRFLQGGALAITNYLTQSKESASSC